jgi:hypothetical protein
MERFDLDFLHDYSDDALLEELRRVDALVSNKTLTQEAFKESSGKVHPQTIIRRFGGWKTALAKAGLEHRFVARTYTDQECFENLAATWTQLGRTPEYREMNSPPSKVGAKAYLRWRTWRKALKAFVDWSNAVDGESNLISIREADSPGMTKVRSTVEDRHDVPLRLKWRAHVRDRFRCVACGKNPPQHGVTLHADHITPWADGGKTVLENLQTLCEPCNLGKGRSYSKLT